MLKLILARAHQLFDKRAVKNTSGVPEERYVIKTLMVLGRRRWPIEITLAVHRQWLNMEENRPSCQIIFVEEPDKARKLYGCRSLDTIAAILGPEFHDT